MKIKLTTQAQKDLSNINKNDAKKIVTKIQTLPENPFPRGKAVKKLVGIGKIFYRLRVGDYRVVYELRGDIIVILICSRSDLIKKLRPT